MNKRLKNIERLYVDTNVFIYLLEGHEKLGDLAVQAFSLCDEFKIGVFTSEITITECLMKPHKVSNEALISLYTDFFKEAVENIQLLPVTAEVLSEVPRTGSEYNLKLVDSIHVATAKLCRCDGFLTNDAGIRVSDADMDVVALECPG